MAATKKERRFRWNIGDKIEDLIRCVANAKLRWNVRTSTSMQTSLNGTMLSEKP